MTLAQSPPLAAFGPIQISSISTPITAPPTNPINWVYVSSAGSGGLVVKDQTGTARTYSGLTVGMVIPGPFTALTSMTLAGLWYGSGAVPANLSLSPSGLNGATVPAGGSLTTGNVLQANGVGSLTYAPINLSGGANYVTGHQSMYSTAATMTASFTAAIDTLWVVNAANTAATASLPTLDTTNDGHIVAIFNAGTTAAVWSPATGDTVGGTASSNATAAGPAAGVLRTLVGNLATRRWIPLA